MTLYIAPGGRVYDSSIGRFLQKDPLAPPGTNPYIYARDNPVTNVNPTGLLSLNAVVNLVYANMPAGISDEINLRVMICLLWKESGFNPQAKNPNSTATGIAQILDGTADDIQDRIARRWGGSDPFYLLAPGERLRNHRTDPSVSIYAAFLYLQDSIQARGTLLGALQRYGPKAQAVLDCANELGKCAIEWGGVEPGWVVVDETEAWRILHKIHQ